MSSSLDSILDNRVPARSEPELADRLFNEAYVLTSGLVGSIGELRGAAEQAAERPGATLAKMATGAALGATLGFVSSRAGIAGLVARGAGAAFGVSFVADAIKPFSVAAGKTWNATSNRDLDNAQRELSARLGSFTFDTLLVAPLAIGGAFAGRGVRTLSSPASSPGRIAADTAPSHQTPGPTTAHNSGGAFRQAGSESRSFAGARPAPRQSKPRVEVLQGEIIEPAAQPKPGRKAAEPEIIDAEFVVVSEMVPEARLALPGNAETLPVKYNPSQGMFQVALRANEHLSLRGSDALRALQRLEPGWQLTSQGLLSPRHSQLTPEQIKRALKAYLDQGHPEIGRFIDLRA
jgi:hypothetical protein